MKPKLLYLAVIAAGIGGGAVRGLMNGRVFDSQTGLMESGHPLTWTLIAITAAAAVASVFTRLDTGKNRALPSNLLKPWVIAACAALGVSGVLGVVDAFNSGSPLTSTILAALGILTAVVIAMLITSGVTSQKLTQGMFATVPIFWTCFWFLSVFAENSANPVMMSYLYEFLAVLFTMAAASVFAGFYFGSVKTRLLGITVTLGLFFTFISLTAPVVSLFINAPSSGVSAGGILRLVFSLMYLAAIPALARDAAAARDGDGGDGADNKEEESLDDILLEEKEDAAD